jgi:molybdenum cofactor cytidylyltransferase
MKMQMLPTETTVGTILCHNIDDGRGGKAFAKGHAIQPDDVARLQALGHRSVYVVSLEPGDVHEDPAATRLARAVVDTGVEATRANTGRVNLLAQHHGVVTVKPDALQLVNGIDGLTVATLPRYSVVGNGKIAATIKIIPYAVSEDSLRQAEEIGRAAGGIVGVRPLPEMTVAIVLTGSEAAREQVTSAFEPPLRERVQALGSRPLAAAFVAEEPAAIAKALSAALKGGAGMVIIAGQTSIMDKDDITPQGIRLAGGAIEHYGVPVEPGNLLLLAYAGTIPIMGAPGCARSRQTNVIDLVLPRLLSGEHMTRQDLIALGNGGLL